MTDVDNTFRLDLTINLLFMLGTGAFFLGFPAAFAEWPPAHFADVASLIISGEVYGLANALWAKSRGRQGGPLGARILKAAYGSAVGGVIIILATYVIQVVSLEEPLLSTDLLVFPLLLFAPPLGALATVLVVWLYDKRQVG